MRDQLGKRPGPRRGQLTGPNPTDRGKKGSKFHLVVDRQNLPLSIDVSAANLHDGQALIPLVVLTWSVVHTVDRWVSAECGVAGVVVVGVQEVCQGFGPLLVGGVGP